MTDTKATKHAKVTSDLGLKVVVRTLIAIGPLLRLLTGGASLTPITIATVALIVSVKAGGGPMRWKQPRSDLQLMEPEQIRRLNGNVTGATTAAIVGLTLSMPGIAFQVLLSSALLAPGLWGGMRWLVNHGPEWKVFGSRARAVHGALHRAAETSRGRVLVLGSMLAPVTFAIAGMPVLGGPLSLGLLVLCARPHMEEATKAHQELLDVECKERPEGRVGKWFGGATIGQQTAGTGVTLHIEAPETLPTFAKLGGMHDLKAELQETVGEVLRSAGTPEAEAYGVAFGAILLTGPPGSGKSFPVRCLAGELGINFALVSVSDLSSQWKGEGVQKIREIFAAATAAAKERGGLVLLLDEIDAVAERRDGGDSERNMNVAQLLVEVEAARLVSGLVVLATSNRPEALDPAVFRAGRFDRKITVPLPDAESREAILSAQLKGRPGGDSVDTHAIAGATKGKSAADLSAAVDRAALAAMRQGEPIRTEGVMAALRAGAGTDRPTIEDCGRDTLVLEDDLNAELDQIIALVQDPSRAESSGIQPPSGLLFYGPPGTGKTSIARAVAAESGSSFYALDASALMSKWLGESEAGVRAVFERARANEPSIVFIDEVDAIGGDRGGFSGDGGARNRVLNQLLTEIDGFRSSAGVMVIAATNRPEVLDPALMRGGRLERHIEIGLPGLQGRRKLLALQTAGVRVASDVDLDAIAELTDGLAPADLAGLIRAAGLRALVRDGDLPAVEQGDLLHELGKLGRAA